MYLTYLPLQDRKNYRKAFDLDKQAQDFYALLQNHEKDIFVSIVPNEDSILYEVLLSEKEVVGIKVLPNKSIVSPYGTTFKPTGKALGLLLYVCDVDSASSQEDLKARYGASYQLLARLAPLSKEELRSLLSSRDDFRDLIEDLRFLGVTESSTTRQPILSFALDHASKSFCDFSPLLLGEKMHRVTSYSKFFRDIREGNLIADGKGSYLSLSLSSFSPEDQRVLFALLTYQADSAELGYGSGKAINPAIVPDLLALCPGKTIYIDGDPARIDEEIQTVSVSIDQDGKMQANSMPRGDVIIYGKSHLLVYKESEGTVHLYAFLNEKAKALYRFVQEHPSFPYAALQEEVAASLLPLLGKEVQVDDAFKQKALVYRAVITYRITLDEEEDTAKLFFETSFLNRGEPISKEQFRALPGSSYDAFAAALEELSLPENGTFTKDDDIGRALSSDFSTLSSLCSLYLSDNITPTTVKKHPAISFTTSSGLDWFEVQAQSNELTAEEINAILKAYKKKKKYVRIGASYYRLDDSMLEEADLLPDGDGLTSERLPLYQALKLKSEFGDAIEIDDKLQALFARLLDFSSTQIELDPNLEAILRPYQKEGVKWLKTLADNSLAGILADDMGLGKTLEIIAYLSLTKGELDPTLIVAPKSLLYNWKSEFNRFDPTREVSIIEGSKSERAALVRALQSKKGDIYIVSYDSLRNDESLYQSVSLSNLILDEGQFIANAKAQKSKAVKSIKAIHRFVLTGTPIQNSYMDLWSIMDFLLPQYLEGYSEFRMIYNGFSDEKTAEIAKLEAEIAPFLLRRRKEDVLKDLPPKTEEVMVISMEEKEKKLYSAYLENAKLTMRQEKEDRRSRVAVLAELTRLRQICVDPSVFLDSYDEVSSKLAQTLSMVKQSIASGHKILIFSSFVAVLKHFQSILDQEGIASHLIYGDTSAKERLQLASDFNSKEDSKVMLISLKAGGTGLNLIGADIVIHLDPWWNLAAENQASDRAHRIGQTRPVSIYKLVAQGTIEEKIIQLQELKRGLTDILRDSGESGSGLTEEDIAFLLSE